MATGLAPAPDEDAKALLLKRYDASIAYYWRASKRNKNAYKFTRYLTIFLGAIVTLVASLQSADFMNGTKPGWLLPLLTPILAASLAIVGGVSQAFQWSAAWSDMTVTATRLQKERDRLAVTKPSEIEAVKEMGVLDDFVISETQGFFQRLFGSGSGKTD